MRCKTCLFVLLEANKRRRVTVSDTGYINDAIGVKWLVQQFHPQTAADAPGNEYRALLVDGHSSHNSIEFIYKTEAYKTQLFLYPPHSSHIYQSEQSKKSIHPILIEVLYSGRSCES